MTGPGFKEGVVQLRFPQSELEEFSQAGVVGDNENFWFVFHGFPSKKRDSRGNPTGRQCKLNSGKSVAKFRNFADSASAFLRIGRLQPKNS
jgi:hypothetical protein